jgi:putative phosphoesterase
MRFLIASDLHGSEYYLEKVLKAWEREGKIRILFLGDILYHGPRNDLPRGYAPKEVMSVLNSMKNELLCIRGNCDAEVDQMVLDFPIMSETCILPLIKKAGNDNELTDTGRLIYCTHGHIYNENNLPPLRPGDILLHGHTHIPRADRVGEITILNPGSVSIPKNDSPHSYAILEDGIFTLKTLDGEIMKSVEL